MKNKFIIVIIISIIVFAFLPIGVNAFEIKGFIGLNAIQNKGYLKLYNNGEGKSEFSGSINLGTKFKFYDKFFATTEVYAFIYNKLYSSQEEHLNYFNEKTTTKHNYGFKLGGGYNFKDNFSASIKIGLNNISFCNIIEYSDSYRSYSSQHEESKFANTYGIELSYAFNDNLEASFGYDYFKILFNTQIYTDVKSYDNQYSLGIRYLF